MTDSCIVKHFSHYANLTGAERALLAALEDHPEELAAGTEIRSVGHRADHFFTMTSGWAYSYRMLRSGDQQILDLYMPGEVMGLREIAFEDSLCGLRTLTDAKVCPFSQSRIDEVLASSTRLTRIFMLVMARESAILVERVINLGRRSAAEKLAHFIAELQARLELIHERPENEIELPFSQAVIGDILGITSVHVSRSFRLLKEKGLAGFERDRVVIYNAAALRDYADFDRAYLVEDQSWVEDAPVL